MTQRKVTTTRLNIAGFKSFADEIQLDILPGLTGIVGPNGCGKSNIVEALRWTMGENSARALRGGDSDDLIFSGSKIRPARNLARVTLHLTNTISLASPPFHKADDLEISREAHRTTNSTYRINGQIVRARDVQTIFADLSSGARSSSIISQNRVSQLITSRPEERRLLLEEAAGITGIHTRRRDAELKLKQTESNLEHSQEHYTRLSEYTSQLAQQAEHAQKYRTYSDIIRTQELTLLTIQHKSISIKISTETEKLNKTSEEIKDIEKSLSIEEKNHSKILFEYNKNKEYQYLIQKEIESINTIKQDIKTSITHKNELKNEYNNQINLLEKEIKKHKSSSHNIEINIKDTKNDIREIKNILHEKEYNLHEKQKYIHSINKKEQEATLILQEASQTLEDISFQYKNLENQSYNIKQQLIREEKRLSSLLNQQDKYQIPKDLISSLQIHEEKISKLSHEIKNLEEKYQISIRHTNNANVSYENLSYTLQESIKNKQSLEEQRDTLSSNIKQNQNTLEKLHQEVKELSQQCIPSTKIQELEKRKDQTQARHKQKELLLTNLSKEKEEANNDYFSTEIKIETNNQRAHYLNSNITRLKNEYEHILKRHQEETNKIKDNHKNIISEEIIEKKNKSIQELILKEKNINTNIDKIEVIINVRKEEEEETLFSIRDLERSILLKENEYHSLCTHLKNTTINIPYPVLEHLNIPENLTTAFSSALPECFHSSLLPPNIPLTNLRTSKIWRDLPRSTTHPAPTFHDLAPLSHYIQAPSHLLSALNLIFLVKNSQQGFQLQQHLMPGQILVNLEGTIWRWDGFISRHNSASPEKLYFDKLRLKEELSRQLTKEKDNLSSLKERASVLSYQNKEDTSKYEITLQKRNHISKELKHREEELRVLTANYLLHRRTESITKDNIESLNTALKNIEKKIDHTYKELQSISHVTIENIEKSRNDIYHRYHSTQNEYNTTKNEIEKINIQMEEFKALNYELKNKIKYTQEIIQYSHSENERKRGNLNTIINHISTINIPHIQNEHKKRITDLQNYKVEENKNFTILQEYKNHITQERDTLSKKVLLIENNSESLSRIKDEILSVQSLKNEIKNKLSSIEREITHLPQLSSIQDKRKITYNEFSLITKEKNSTEEIIRSLEKNIIHLQSNILQKEQELSFLNEKNTTENNNIIILNQKITHINYKIKEIDIYINKKYNLLNEKQKSFQKLEENIKKSSLSSKEKKKRIHYFEKNIHSLSANIKHKKETYIRINERLIQNKKSYASLLHNSPLPQDPPNIADISLEHENRIRKELKTTQRARDNMGAVNLCAEEEYCTAQKKLYALEKEHHDLTHAIQHLRSAISAINKEGRQRLMTTFADINQHFQTLFTRMFNGGSAHLKMVGHDDPLLAGLEIFAQPPGKKLSTLSLLSGGEQALTALSLIFGSFHCTPAPICVLDEVDAPLDDANVERFCSLLKEIAQTTHTRFLVVTHHQLTMAYMDRLFGVTMQERGVSRLLSVNLDESIQMTNG